MVMGTGSTMTSLAEAMGMTLTGCASIPAADSRRNEIAERSGARIVAMVRENLTPDKIITRKSIENAIRVNMAIGGSTNAVVHLLAIAGRAGVGLNLDDFDRISSNTPLIADLKPGGPAYPIPAADTICGVSGLSVSVYSLNDTCGYKSRVDAFRDEVVAHEFEHEESLNKCIERVNRRLGDIEEIVGYLDGVDGNIFTLWTYPLLKAAETAQGAMLASIWEYRPGPWSYIVVTNPHGGTDGCPQI